MADHVLATVLVLYLARRVSTRVFNIAASLSGTAIVRLPAFGSAHRPSITFIADLAAKEPLSRSSRVCVCFHVNLDIDIGRR